MRARIAAAALAVLLSPWCANGQPAAPLRVIAEWEPAVGTLVSYPFELPNQLVIELARDDTLFVLVNGTANQQSCQTFLSTLGVDPARVVYIQCSVQTEWTRDWGPHQIFDGNGQWALIDPIFRGYPWVPPACAPITSPGGYTGDNAVPAYVAAHFGAPLYSLPAYLVGGNFLVNGHATAFSTCQMIGENNQLWTEAQFRQIARDWLGITDYVLVDNTENNGIQHIDCWFKPLDEERLLVKRVPTWHEEYSRIEANLQTLAALTNVHGRPYQIIRIDCPPYSGGRVANYCNALILNRKVLVPLFGIPGDAAALATWQAAMPGYQVIGFPWSAWYYYDALHCRTRAVFDRHMLRITHRRLDATVPVAAAHNVVAHIEDYSQAGLIADSLRVYWRAGDGAWIWAPLTPTGTAHEYAGHIPGQPWGTRVEYYLAAADNSGRSETLPRPAPAGCYAFQVGGAGLSIDASAAPTLAAPWTPTVVPIVLRPGDEAVVPGSALLYYRFVDGPFFPLPLVPTGNDLYVATLPRFACADHPAYYVVATGALTGPRQWPAGGAAAPQPLAIGVVTPASVFAEAFTAPPAGWQQTGLWHFTDACGTTPTCDPAPWAHYARSTACNYNTGARTTGALTSPTIPLPAALPGAPLTLTYCSRFVTENHAGYDVAELRVGAEVVDAPVQSSAWQTRSVDLSAYAGQEIALTWFFDSVDGEYNNYLGWQVDDVAIAGGTLHCDSALPYAPGDVNCDGVRNFADINPFVLALGGHGAYAAGFPDCHWRTADCNGDGAVTFSDIDPFVAALGH